MENLTPNQEQVLEMKNFVSQFLEDRDLYASDLRSAYLLALGIPAEELPGAENENIQELSSKLKSYFDGA